MDDLIKYQQHRVIKPSTSVSNQYRRSSNFRSEQEHEDNTLGIPPNVDREIDTKHEALYETQADLENHIKKDRSISHSTGYLSSLHLNDQIVQLLEQAIHAVIRYDHENQIGNRRFRDRKIREDRLKQYVNHAGMAGVNKIHETRDYE